MSYQSVPRTNYQPPSLAPYMEPGEDASGFVKLEIETVDLTVGGLSGEISLFSLFVPSEIEKNWAMEWPIVFRI